MTPLEAAGTPLDATEVADAVRDANVPTLLAMLIQMTGSMRWFEDRYQPERPRGLSESDGGGLAEDVQEEIRAAATVAICDWIQGVPVALPNPAQDVLLRILSFSVGEKVPDEYADYLEHDLQTAGAPLTSDPASALSGLSVVIVGAGVSGIAAAIKLKMRGADVTILEKTSSVGGTWNLNRYPGCGVDTASHLYSYSFAPYDWEYYYSPQPQLKSYLEKVAVDFKVHDDIKFGTEVLGAQFDSSLNAWHVQAQIEGESVVELTADVLITAVGAFGRPSRPPIIGLDSFAGPLLHTGDWPDDVDLAGKNVSVIGNGASAMQLVPAIAETVQSLTVYQRSPQWAAPFEQFHLPVPIGVRRLLRTVPLYFSWYRARLGWLLNDKVHESLQIDPEWPDISLSINAINEGHRRFFTRYIEAELGPHVELRGKTIPQYPPFGKRMLLDNRWFKTLTRDNVELVTEPIAAVDASGVATTDGVHRDTDVLVLATGFDVVHYLAPMQITGNDGQLLSDVWDGDNARAYLGVAMPGFPNLFCFYGPNGAPGHGGSFINNTECQLDYLIDLLVKMRSVGATAVDCRQDVHDEYNRRVDAANEAMIWSHPDVSTYYRNSRGRVVYTNPWRIVDFWHMTRFAELTDYELRYDPLVVGAKEAG